MTDNQQRLLFIAALAVAFGLFALVSWLKERRKSRIPVMEWEATIVSGRLISQSARGGGVGHYTMRSCLTVFKLADGSLIELTAPEELSQYPAGTKGTVIFQGTKCEKFTPHE